MIPFSFDTSAIVKAIAIDKDGKESFVTTANYIKVDNDWEVKLNTPYEQHYDGGGKEGVIDGIFGSTNWRKGNWQGYEKSGMDIIIDMKKATAISKVSASFLQDVGAWIVAPKQITISVSEDGVNYKQVFAGRDLLPVEDRKVQVKNVEAAFNPVTARYVRVKADQFGKMPSWHEGAGGDSHIFIDEIIIK